MQTELKLDMNIIDIISRLTAGQITLADKIANLPSLPTEAGTYRLKVTVTAGKASYEWVSA